MRHPALKRWPIIEDMLKREGIARPHLNSFDDFVEFGIPAVIDEQDHIPIADPKKPYRIKLGKIKIEKPRIVELDGSIVHISPAEARMRSITYAAPIMMEIQVVEDDPNAPPSPPPKFVHIGDLPIMVKAKTCILHGQTTQKLLEYGEDSTDSGGYFIINGSERIIVGAEDLSFGKIMVDTEEKAGHTYYKSKIYSAIIGYRSKLELVMKGDGPMLARIAGSPVSIPVVYLMRALGLPTDKEVATTVSLVDEVINEMDSSFDHSTASLTIDDAVSYLGKRIAPGMVPEFQLRRAEAILDWGLLPHIGKLKSNRKEKAHLLGEAACKLLELRRGWIVPDDRDHCGNKVIKFSGQMLADLFRSAFRNLVKDVKYQIERSGQKHGLLTVTSAIRPGIITDNIRNALATGNWGRARVGVTQSLDRTNYLSTITHLRRMQSALSRSQANYKARDVHSSHYGRICPSETPEGSNCGLVKNLALCGITSQNVSSHGVSEKLYDLGVIHPFDALPELRKDGTRVFVDGRLMGFHEDGQALAKQVRQLRRDSEIHPHIGVATVGTPEIKNSTKRLYISCNAGRLIRPLIIITDDQPMLTDQTLDDITNGKLRWFDLLKMGIMELIDADEEENYYVALDERKINGHTHLEIYPPAILGAAASIIPYPEHNQSPRVTYFSSMAKQGLGFSTPMKSTSTYTRQHVLLYPQAPLVKTRSMKLLGIEDRPAGMNCIVAVLPFDGYNIEDAIVFSKAAVDRGLGRSFFYRVYSAESRQYPAGARDNFETPSSEDSISGYRGSHAYRLLDEDGVASLTSIVAGGDVLMGVTSPPRFMNDFSEFSATSPNKRDNSVLMRPTESGVVDTVLLTQSGRGGKLFKVRTRNMRIPEIGDKFASRHGQKGVMGFLARAEDLPYTDQGMSPDIMINPHAFPSRMTVGQLVESIGGKAAALRGTKFDGSPFVGEKVADTHAVLKAHGFKYTGKERMYDGRTGAAFPVDVFIGVVYYLKLQHMVADKMQARARGPIHPVTKQPTAGKAKGGGLRFGEMERDCIIAYGASMILRDRLLDESDKSDLLICERCGLIAYHDIVKRQRICRVCGRRARFTTVSVAYAFKLLLQEMQGLNIAPRLLVKSGLSHKR